MLKVPKDSVGEKLAIKSRIVIRGHGLDFKSDAPSNTNNYGE
jgi:hypothetical protein